MSRRNRVVFVSERGLVDVTDRLPDGAVVSGYSGTSDGAAWLAGRDGLYRMAPGIDTHPVRIGRDRGLPSDSTVGVYSLGTGENVAVTQGGLARIVTGATGVSAEVVARFSEGPVPHGHSALADAAALWVEFGDHVVRYSDGGTRRIESHHDRPGLELGDFRWTAGTTALIRRPLARHLRVPPVELEGGGRARRAALVLVGRDGTVWWAVGEDPDGDGPDHLIRSRDGRAEVVALRRHHAFDRINHLLEDREGSVWIATDQGALQLVPRKVQAVTPRHGLVSGFTTAVTQTPDGAVWAGTWGGGLHRFADGSVTRLGTEDGLPADEIRALLHDGETLWVGTSGGYAAVRDGRVVRAEAGPALRNPWGASREEVRAFTRTADGRLWMGGMEGLFRLEEHRGWVPVRPDLFRTADLWMLHGAVDGSLWVGGAHGLFRLNGAQVRRFGPSDGLDDVFVVSAHEEVDGTLWLGTYRSGLRRWRDGRWTTVSTQHGLHADGVWRMVHDDDGGVWMASDVGVFRVDHERLDAVADALARGERPSAPLAPVVLQEPEGMPSRESNRASPAGWRLGDGRIVFNSQGGLAVLDPREATTPEPLLPVLVDRVLADGQPVGGPTDRTRTVSRGSRHVDLEYFAVSYRAPTQTRYRYRLDGYDQDWRYAGSERRASYTNLPPGRYTFRVQAAKGAGPWAGAETRQALVIPPFFWQRRSTQAAGLLALLALGLLAHRYHVRRALEMERFRLRVAADLHDDVGSSLSSIALLSEMLGRGDTVGRGLEARQLRRIHQAATETMDALRDVIWLTDPRHGDSEELVRRLRSVAGDLLGELPFRFETIEFHSRPLPTTLMRNALLAYKEALHNVVRHADAGHVAIRVSVGRATLRFMVADDGRGFEPAQPGGGYGLGNMRRRARESGGSLDVESGPGGTRVTFAAKIP